MADRRSRTTRPGLVTHAPPAPPVGVILLLHGGTPTSRDPVTARNTSWRRAALQCRAITPGAHRHRVATAVLRYATRGWNGGGDRLRDARWALAELRERLGPLPVVLLGHSMGARVAVHVADDPWVHGVVGLAPWWPPDEPVAALTGRSLVGAHGSRDQVTSPAHSRVFVRRATPVATTAEMLDMGPVGHYMLRAARRWNHVALGHSLAALPR